MIPFIKTEALGNDFILACSGDISRPNVPELARRLCDRRLGIGADGLILWKSSDDGIFDVRIFNSDGSEAECSGNGLRGLAAHLFRSAPADGRIRLRTVSGTYVFRRTGNGYTADMGVPELTPRKIPFVAADNAERIVDHPFEVAGETLRITCCATGNPHCSLFVDVIDADLVERIGPAIERHPAFPNGTNVEFIHVLNNTEIEVAFWERGAGRTPASGTGSCGATVACVLNDRTERHVRVHTENGELGVEWRPDGRLELNADATVVAEGNYLLMS